MDKKYETEDKENIIEHNKIPTGNPFSLFKNYINESKVAFAPITKNTTIKIDDEQFFEILKKKNIESKPNIKEEVHKPILDNFNIIIEEKMDIKMIKYYKFPFSDQIKVSDTQLFAQLYAEWKIAFKNVFSNYRKYSYSFVMKFDSEFLIFDTFLQATLGMKKYFIKNDIKFEQLQNHLKILSPTDILLVYDFIINIEVNQLDNLPFIISKHEYYNSTVYETTITTLKPIKKAENIFFTYKINGYFLYEDFKEYINKQIKF
ncbi:DUF5095 domain-containing protein [Hamiltosporidium magnivora]|uniref:DUF5095 domain-containing protein n=1 Tax=Hamiltosporidium magnivora TaxID=148818 RepID=A0A4Q9LMI9_9MICR|nr:DUF5095 domain-containing protein [Hamiltosporidium magnivora]